VVRDIDDDKNARKNAILLSNDNSGFIRQLLLISVICCKIFDYIKAINAL
jgi:hypothetical protein